MDNEMERQIMYLQNLEKQFQSVLIQKQQMELQLNEIGLALEELGKTKEKNVYKSVGGLLIKTTTEEAKKDLEEKEKLFEDTGGHFGQTL